MKNTELGSLIKNLNWFLDKRKLDDDLRIELEKTVRFLSQLRALTIYVGRGVK